ncbi:MAG: hypothetical protein GFH27_549281n178 [Chloroflexi bacterium AL-W]|nr:hypothetical protein [Chloroflexi bacterium AL-N1]NOK66064.1 hypothetical protein [Chloroflexi bacterium AL-N10]NOK72945.1 hypothetical protein [Chloroflexi bacterium AL-N5]NOK79842.1 hypothetical protein [Chloroflexi bacterium AL-W]NOK88302.1 hypothetical protein [Chloroflexi bacterium AL-N15]
MPLYVQLKRLLEAQVSEGTLVPHSRIPSERELSDHYTISRMTARRALAELVQEGRLYTSTGKGTFVAEPKIDQSVQALTSFTEDMQARGLIPSTRILRRELTPASDIVARSLWINAGDIVYRLERLRLANGEPLALENAYLSFPGVEFFDGYDLEGSLYAMLRERFGLVPVEAIQEFEARLPRSQERRLLKMNEGEPVLKLLRTTFNAEHNPFEVVQSIYRGDRYRFVAKLIRESTDGKSTT